MPANDPTSNPAKGIIKKNVAQQRQTEVEQGEFQGFHGPSQDVVGDDGRLERKPYDMENFLMSWVDRDELASQLSAQTPEPIYNENGLPADWDYKTSKVGPWGEVLPTNAVGWTPLGKPYYDKPGPLEWLYGQFNELADAFYGEQKTSAELAAEIPEQYQLEGKAQRERRRGIREEDGWWAAMKDWAADGIANLNHVYRSTQYNENSPSVLKVTSWALSTAIEGALQLMNEPARLYKKIVTPRVIAMDMWMHEQDESYKYVEEGWLKWIGQQFSYGLSHPTKAIEAQIWLMSREGKEVRQELKEAQVWRMGYTAATNDVLREEYMRRARSGEDPRLLALELEDAKTEMIGEIVFDPLNWAGMILGKPIAAARKAAKATERAATIIAPLSGLADEIVEAGKIADAATLGTKLQEISQKVQDAVQGYQWKAGKGRKAVGTLDEIALKRGARILTAGGKRSVFGTASGNVINIAATHFANDADGFLDFIHAMAMLGSDNLDDVQRGLLLLADTKMPMNVALSSAGVETAQWMHNIMYDAAEGTLRSLDDFVKGIEHLDDVAKVAEQIGGKLDRALIKTFPTLTEQIRHADEFAKLTDDAAKAAYLAKRPYAAAGVSDYMRSLDKAHGVMQRFVYKPMAWAQGVAYMGLNPVYRLRNKWTNTVHVLIDQGPKAAYKSLWSADAAGREIAEYLGAIPRSAQIAFKTGGGPAASQGIGDGILHYFSGKAAKDEVAAATHVYANSVRSTMRKSVAASLADSPQALSAFSESQIELVQKLAVRYKGNVDKITDALLQTQSGKGYSAVKNLLFLSEDDITKLQDLKLYDGVLDRALKNDNLDDAIREIEELRTGHHNLADQTAKEAISPATATNKLEQAEMDDLEQLEDALNAATGSTDETAIATDKLSRQIHQDRRVRLIGDQKVQEVDTLARDNMTRQILNNGGGAEDVTKAHGLLDKTVASSNKARKELSETIVQESDTLRNRTWALDAETRGVNRLTGKPQPYMEHTLESYKEWWSRAKLSKRPDSYFEDLVKMKPHRARRQLRREIWNGDAKNFYAVRDEIWTRHRKLRRAIDENQIRTNGKIAGLTQKEIKHKIGAIDAEDLISDQVRMAKIGNDGQLAIDLSRTQLKEMMDLRYQEAISAGMTEEQAREYALRSIAGRNADNQNLVRQVVEGRTLDEEADALRQKVEAGKATKAEKARLGKIDKQLRPGIKEDIKSPRSVSRKSTLDNGFVVETKYDRKTKSYTTTVYDEKGKPIGDALSGAKDAAPKNHTDALVQASRASGERGATMSGNAPRTYRLNVITAADDVTPTHARWAHESRAVVDEALDNVIAGLRENWDTLRAETFSPDQLTQLDEWAGTFRGRMTEARAMATQVADAQRSFTLLNYQHRYGADLVAGYLFPYQFWYSRTYANWLKRAVEQPEVIANYAKYRTMMEKIHAGSPEWFRYQHRMGEFGIFKKPLSWLGVDEENPIYFNLEASLNPLHGLTGIDFEDPRRRKDWWSKTVEDLGKFGPTLWTGYSLALATAYKIQGEDEAASRWAGRGIPITQSIRDMTALAGMGEGKGVELDPIVWLYSGGLPAHDQARVGRSLAQLMGSGKYSEAHVMDAAYTQEGPIWDEAVVSAIHKRAPNLFQIAAPLFLGAGFRPRSQQDVEIDRMYAEMYGVMGRRDLMAPEEYQSTWNELRKKYPFMDAILLARKTGPERDESYAWNVLNRIPPGGSTKIYEMVGTTHDIMGKFYDVKGDITQLSEPERMEFMAAVLKIGAILDMPSQPTRDEWNEVKRRRSEVDALLRKQYGPEIDALIDAYYTIEYDEQADYLRRNPAVKEALQLQKKLYLGDPLMASYYMPIDKIERYLKGTIWSAAEKQWGEHIFDKFEVYYRLKDMDRSADAKRYWRENPELEEYIKFRDAEYEKIALAIEQYGMLIPDPLPEAYREGAAPKVDEIVNETEAWIRAQVMDAMGGEETSLTGQAQKPQIDYGQLLRSPSGKALIKLLQDRDQLGVDLPDSAAELLEAYGFMGGEY